MLLPDNRLIYLHVPKTGGNAITHVLLPFSEDRLVIVAHHDGLNRFGVTGPHTPRKHALLQEYKHALGGTFAAYRVAISVRDPLERAVSFYFSPHRWMHRSIFGWRRAQARWSLRGFTDMLDRMIPLVGFLTVDGELIRPDFVIRHRYIEEDLLKLERAVGIVGGQPLLRVNQSVGSPELIRAALADPVVDRLVREKFALDYALLASLGSL